MANGNNLNLDGTPNNGNGSTAAIVATVLIVTLVVAVAVVVIVLVVAAGNNTGGVNVTINECSSGNVPRGAKPSLVGAAKPAAAGATNGGVQFPNNSFNPGGYGDDPIARAMQNNATVTVTHVGGAADDGNNKNNNDMPVYRPADSGMNAFDGTGNTTSIYGAPQTGGIMNRPEAVDKKWNPDKAFPNPDPAPRPSNSMGAQFAPSSKTLQMYLPSRDELDMAKKQTCQPKNIRRGPRFKRDSILSRPIVLPPDYDDYDKVHRPNRPHINQDYFAEAIQQDQRIFGAGAGVTTAA